MKLMETKRQSYGLFKYGCAGLFILAVMLALTGCRQNLPPQTPQPESPFQKVTSNPHYITFAWEAVDNVSYYKLQVSKREDFIQITFQDSTITSASLSVESDLFTDDGYYYWRVSAGNQAGWSEWSNTADFLFRRADDVPKLVYPEDGSHFTDNPPDFVWTSRPWVSDYVFCLCADSFPGGETMFQDTLKDTAYTLAYDVCSNLPSGPYHWGTGTLDKYQNLFWIDGREIIIVNTPSYDTTYFPFKIGYQWRFKRHEWGLEEIWTGEMIEKYNLESEYVVSVVDCSWVRGGIYFICEIEGFGEFECQKGFMDYPRKFWDEWIEIIFLGRIHTIRLMPDISANSPVVKYYGDTLYISEEKFNDLIASYIAETASTKRLKGIGIINQSYSYREEIDWAKEKEVRDTLLWFYNGVDTVYKAENFNGGMR